MKLDYGHDKGNFPGSVLWCLELFKKKIIFLCKFCLLLSNSSSCMMLSILTLLLNVGILKYSICWIPCTTAMLNVWIGVFQVYASIVLEIIDFSNFFWSLLHQFLGSHRKTFLPINCCLEVQESFWGSTQMSLLQGVVGKPLQFNR